ncbi:hypothetical protein BH11BAC3_BH11BAC3_21960 [soil metagenome]
MSALSPAVTSQYLLTASLLGKIILIIIQKQFASPEFVAQERTK